MSAALLVAGAIAGGALQTGLFAAALVIEWVSVYVTSRHGSWRIHSVAHWTERHGLFIIIAIGESIVAIGTGAAGDPVTTRLLVAATLGISVAICLWWLYFDTWAITAEQQMADADEDRRLTIAVDAYTYGHYLLVAGIVLIALGIELAIEALAEPDPLGAFAAAMLFGGLAVHLAGHCFFKLRAFGSLSTTRAVAMVVFVAAAPIGAHVPPMVPCSSRQACWSAHRLRDHPLRRLPTTHPRHRLTVGTTRRGWNLMTTERRSPDSRPASMEFANSVAIRFYFQWLVPISVSIGIVLRIARMAVSKVAMARRTPPHGQYRQFGFWTAGSSVDTRSGSADRMAVDGACVGQRFRRK